jgi:phosphate uptake regulator
MKVSTNLESVADRSVTIARRAKHLNNRPAVRELTLLEPAYRLAVAIFRDSLRAFADGDYELARTLKLKEKKLDALTSDLSEKLVGHEVPRSDQAGGGGLFSLRYGRHTSAIMRSRNDPPAVMRTTTWSDTTNVPPVTPD